MTYSGTEGHHTSVKCLRCGTDLEYWVCENPDYACQCRDLKYKLVVGCRTCLDQLGMFIFEDAYNHSAHLAEQIAKCVQDYQRKKMGLEE